MNGLLALAVNAHGGLQRWQEVSHFRVAASITGAIWALKGKPGLLADVELEGEARDQRLKITPFPWPGRYSTWEPYRQTIETDDGMLVAERRDPLTFFAELTRRSSWDDLQVAYLAGEASWNYLVAPFVFARPDFVTEEAGPWDEDGQTWQRLVVTYPDTVAAHCRQQTYYFDGTGLLRRLDYTVDILGGGPAVHYPSDYREFAGIMVPTRRRVYVRNPDGSPMRDSVSFAIDIEDVTFI
jgi:hypothetical protein